MNRNESDWFGMNFNPKLLPGRTVCKCRLRKVDDETLLHICSYSEVHRVLKEKVVDGLKEWVANDSGDDLERKINRELSTRKPVIALCEYVAEFKRVVLK